MHQNLPSKGTKCKWASPYDGTTGEPITLKLKPNLS